MVKPTPGSATYKTVVSCDSFHLRAREWTQATMICGGIGIIFALYEQSTELDVALHYGGESVRHMFSTKLEVNRSATVSEYLRDVAESVRTSMPNGVNPSWFLPASLQQQNTNASINSLLGLLEVKVDFKEEQIRSTTSPIWFQCAFEASKSSLSAAFEKDHHDEKFVKRLLSQLSYITGQLSVSSTLIRGLNLVSDKDAQDIRRWNPIPAPANPLCVHGVISQHVIKFPEAAAVHSWDGKLTYRELHELSSNLAAQLSAVEAPKGSVISLLFEKSMWTVVAIIAVLKSGYAFLLLDASHPTGRLEILTREINGPIIMTSEIQKDRAVFLAPRVIVVSSTTLKNAPNLSWDQKEVAEPHDLAVVVFTSGTTGRPKATAIEHHSICSSLMGLAEIIGISETCRFYQFSSYAWDAAFGEMLMTLFSGACICIPSEEERLNRLAQSITSLNANYILLTPTVLRLLSPQDVPTLRNVIMGGEKVTRGLVRIWARHVNLTTVYAPAECTVACMANQQFGEQFDPAMIGSAFGCRVWITLDDNFDQLAPVGVVGELLVEGSNVARGYLNDHNKTAESFLEASPHWMAEMNLDRIPYSRFYRTGDLARYTLDGKIVFVGRRDFQVKLRGQRIELEEIQSQIQRTIQLPGAQIFVDIVDFSKKQRLPRLAAFVHLPEYQDKDRGCEFITEHMASESDRIRLALMDIFPDFMVPTTWIPIPVVPLSSSGKLDRRALVRIGNEYLSGLQTKPQMAEKLTKAQWQLSQLWAQVLSAQCSGLHDNFFQLGGDSVQAMQLVSLAQQAKLKLSVKDVFQYPTLAAMSSIAEKVAYNSGPEISLAFSMLSNDDISRSLAHLENIGYERNDVIDIFPCTQLQEGMFSSSLNVPGSYISQFIFSIHPSKTTEIVKRAWEKTFTALPILRTRFIPSLIGFNQVIMKETLQWVITRRALHSYLELDRESNFNIGEPMARYCIVEDPSSSQVHLVWSLHHSIFDGWSIDRILKHIRSHVEGDNSSEKESNGDFAKFVGFSQKVNTEDARTFWRKQLLGAPVPSFPAVPIEKVQIADRSCVTHLMDASKLMKPGTTITILARAALAIIISHYENSNDVVFGNTIHGRNSLPPELQNVIGPTLATLPIRVKVDRKQTVSEFLANLQEQFIATMPYEQYGLLRIRDIDHNTRSSSSFRALLIVQNADTLQSTGNNIEGREAFRCLHEYPLVITVIPNSTSVKMSWTFDDTLLSRDQVQALALQYEQALAQICLLSDSTRICDLDLASKFDKTCFFDWNEEHHKPVNTSVIELLHEQLKQDPAAMAVDAWDGTLDYESLDKVSNVFAAELVSLGVRPNTLVGHCFEKSMWAPVGLLAIVKAGGAFAPFSADYPRERLLTFVRDAGIKLIICSNQQQASLSGGPWKVLVVDHKGSRRLHPEQGTLPISVHPGSLLYALQTSGTTGQPKTFTVRHTAFATGAVTRSSLIHRGPGRRVLQFGPYTFRLGIENMLATLAAGGCVCIPSDSTIMNNLSSYMEEAKINFANVTPSVARTLRPDKVPDLEVLLVSGEPPDRDLIATWTGRVQLINGYGPSEFAAKQTLNFNMTEDDPQNLGRAVGSSLWVVDPENHERLSPLGAIGELLIEGPTLADGYISRPSETEKRFISTPAWLRDFRMEQTAIFKTGDLVRYNLDGSLTSIGRVDGQVKIHGQRFEAKEVEQRIKHCLPNDQLDVLVDVLGFEGQESEVVAAFLAPKEHKLRDVIELNMALGKRVQSEKRNIVEYLSRFLPGYMVPSIFLGVSMIPVTVNGKVDRRALKTFGSHLPFSSINPKDSRVMRPPRSDEEKALHGLWRKVLGLKENQFGVDDHFFELGGSSMAVIRLVAMAREIQVSLVAQSIFKHPVLRNMALQLKRTNKNMMPTSIPKFSLLKEIGCNTEELKSQLPIYGMTENDVEDAYPCLALQSYYIKKSVVFPGSTSWEHVFKLPENIDIDRLEFALECVWKSNPTLRTRVISISEKFIQVVCKGEFVCRRFTGLELCYEQDCNSSWALGAPLSRFSIVIDKQDGPLLAYLVWSTNHVIWDAWSRKLIFDDIDYVYQHGSPPSVRPSYKDFIAHACQHSSPNTSLESSILQHEYIGRHFTSLYRVHWTKHVSQNSKQMTMTVELPVLKESNISHSYLLLTAWTLAVAIVEKSNNVLTANEISGRGSSFPGIESLAAPAIAAIPLCVGIHSRTIREHAALVRRHTIEAIAIQHAVDLDKQLVSQMESSAYWILINDQDGYEEPVTKSLQLRRCRAEKIATGMWPFHLTFNTHPGNTSVEIQTFFNLEMVDVEKVVKIYACLKFLLSSIFAAGGLDLNTSEMKLAMIELLEGDDSVLEEVREISSTTSWLQGLEYNPYS